MKTSHLAIIGLTVVIAAIVAFVVIDQFTGDVRVESVQDSDSKIGEFSFVDSNGGKSNIGKGAKLSNPVTISYTGDSGTWTNCTINDASDIVVFSTVIGGNPADYVFRFDGVEGKDIEASLEGGIPRMTFASPEKLSITLMYFESKSGDGIERHYYSAFERLMEGNIILPAYYSDGFFDKGATEQNFDLMTFALNLERSCGFETDNIKDRSESVLKLLSDIGCTKVKANADYYGETSIDSTDAAIGLKQVGGYNIVFLALNGAKYDKEFSANFLAGESGDFEGFSISKNKGLELLREFIEENSVTGKTKLLITGYSRTGAGANLLGAYISDAIHDGKVKERIGNIDLTQEDAYCFSFEPPLCGYYEPDKGMVSPTDPRYDNVWYAINPDDLIVYVPTKNYGFARYGQCYTIPSADNDRAAKTFDLIVNFADQDGSIYDMSRFNRISDISRLSDITSVFIDKVFAKLGTREFYHENVENNVVRASYILLSTDGLMDDIVDEYGGAMSLITNMYVQSTNYEKFMNHFKPFVLKSTGKYGCTEYAENIINTGYQTVELLKRYSNNSMMNIITDKYILATFANTDVIIVPHSPLMSLCYMLQETSYCP